jgi:hypothetical protein
MSRYPSPDPYLGVWDNVSPVVHHSPGELLLAVLHYDESHGELATVNLPLDLQPSSVEFTNLADQQFMAPEAMYNDNNICTGSRSNTEELPLLHSIPLLDSQLMDNLVDPNLLHPGEENITDVFDRDPELFASSSTPSPIQTNPNRKGRKGPLTPEKKQSTAYMRRIGACALCRKRKISCDDGIPCKACVKHLGNKLFSQPCRGEQLKELTAEIIRDNAFPKGRWERFFPNGFRLSKTVSTIYLNLGFGFGQLFPCSVRLIHLGCLERSEAQGHSNPLLHRHIEHLWPPALEQPIKGDRKDPVFPAVLVISNEAQMRIEIDSYLSGLLRPECFQFFPLWKSKLKVLKLIYDYYSKLPAVSWLLRYKGAFLTCKL